MEPWPAESTNRSRSGQAGSAASYFRNLVNSTVAMSAAPMCRPGWPDLACSTASMARTRTAFARLEWVTRSAERGLSTAESNGLERPRGGLSGRGVGSLTRGRGESKAGSGGNPRRTLPPCARGPSVVAIPGGAMTPMLDDALKRLDGALGLLEASVSRRLEADRRRGSLETELQLMQDDRARLALELEGALTRLQRFEAATDDVSKRVRQAIGVVQTVLVEAGQAEPEEN